MSKEYFKLDVHVSDFGYQVTFNDPYTMLDFLMHLSCKYGSSIESIGITKYE